MINTMSGQPITASTLYRSARSTTRLIASGRTRDLPRILEAMGREVVGTLWDRLDPEAPTVIYANFLSQLPFSALARKRRMIGSSCRSIEVYRR